MNEHNLKSHAFKTVSERKEERGVCVEIFTLEANSLSDDVVNERKMKMSPSKQTLPLQRIYLLLWQQMFLFPKC